MNPKMKMLLLPLLLASVTFPVLAEDDLRALVKALSAQVSELSHQVKQSNQRVSELEKKLEQAEKDKRQASATVPAPQPAAATPDVKSTSVSVPAGTATAEKAQEKTKPAITVGDTKGTFKIPGTDTSIGFGGYAKLDVNYSSISAGSNNLGNQVLVASQIPVGASRLGASSQTTFLAKESRFWMKTYTPSSWGDINTFFEFDFFGSTDTYNYTPRLLHAYGTIGNFLAGQTWRTFLNTAAIPDTLDNPGPVGDLTYLRQPVVRWTQPFTVAGRRLEFQVAADSPRSVLWASPNLGRPANAYGFYEPDSSRYPDLVARFNYNPDWGTLSLAGMARQIRYAKAGTTGQQQAWGGAVSLAGKINTYGLDNVRFMLSYGDVLGRYATLFTFEDATLDARGQMQLVNTYSAMLAYQHWWNSTWRSTFAYGFAQADQPTFVTGNITRQAQSLHANLLWSPTLTTTFGLEYIYATRRTVNDETGDLNRVIFSSRFNF